MVSRLTTEEAILEKLDTLIRLQAHGTVAGFDSQKDRILFLEKAGISPKDIAGILGTTPNTVNVVLSKARKAPKSSRSKQHNRK